MRKSCVYSLVLITTVLLSTTACFKDRVFDFQVKKTMDFQRTGGDSFVMHYLGFSWGFSDVQKQTMIYKRLILENMCLDSTGTPKYNIVNTTPAGDGQRETFYGKCASRNSTSNPAGNFMFPEDTNTGYNNEMRNNRLHPQQQPYAQRRASYMHPIYEAPQAPQPQPEYGEYNPYISYSRAPQQPAPSYYGGY